MKLKINLGNKTTERNIIKKDEGMYGTSYTLKCGWFVYYDNTHFNKWRIVSLKKGEQIGIFEKNDIKELG